MTAEIISLADWRPAKVLHRATPLAREDEKALLTRVLLLRITQNLRLSMTAEQHGFLHRYGHLAP